MRNFQYENNTLTFEVELSEPQVDGRPGTRTGQMVIPNSTLIIQEAHDATITFPLRFLIDDDDGTCIISISEDGRTLNQEWLSPEYREYYLRLVADRSNRKHLMLNDKPVEAIAIRDAILI